MSRARAFVVALVTLSVIGTGCGDDDDGSDEASVPSGPSETSAGNGEVAEGEPIVIMNISTLESETLAVPQVETAIRARVALINDEGGVNGRPLEAVFCNDRGDPNEAAACARQAVERDVVAVVGGLSIQAPAILPILEEADIPWVAGMGAGGSLEVTDPISFPIHGGGAALLRGLASAVVEEGATNVAFLGSDVDVSRASGEAVLGGLRDAGVPGEAFFAPAGTVDYSSTVATALSGGVDAVVIAALPDAAPRMVQALRQAQFDGLIAVASTSIPDASIDALGDAAEGLLRGYRLLPPFDSTIPEVAEFIDAMQAEDSDAVLDELAVNAWVGVGFLAEVASQLQTVDGPSVIEFLSGDIAEPIDLGPWLPAYGSLEAPEQFPQARNFVIVIGVVNDGETVTDGEFIEAA